MSAVFPSTIQRCVPLDHSYSNYGMARKKGILDSLISESQMHPMRFSLEGNPENDGLRYDKLLQQKLGSKAFDFVLLRMGDDDHTASLFSQIKRYW